MRDEQDSRVSLCFSPHTDSALSLDPVAEAIEGADSSVLYSIVFLSQLTGRVREALDELMERSLFSYGVAQRTGSLAVKKPDGSTGLLPFAYLADHAPEPFKSEWSGNTTGHSNMVHHKFLVTDFNGERPTVFTGSSNMAAGGEKANGDHLIRASRTARSPSPTPLRRYACSIISTSGSRPGPPTRSAHCGWPSHRRRGRRLGSCRTTARGT